MYISARAISKAILNFIDCGIIDIMLRVLSAVDAASSGTEEVAILLETHTTAGLTDHQVIIIT